MSGIPPVEYATWSIAAAARATGLTQHTLRAWERRFGFPAPVRLPSGHRRFTTEQVERLKLVKRALTQGHRASAVVPLSLERLLALLPAAASDANSGARWSAGVIEHLRAFHLQAVAGALRHASAALGVRAFLEERIIPLLTEVGQRWAAGLLDIRHEHLLSEAVEDELRALRLALEPGAEGRPLLLAALPGEPHGLPLHIVGLAAAARGRRVRLLGLDTPLDEIVATAAGTDAEVVGVTVSSSGCSPRTVVMLNRLYAAVAPRATVWVGGSGLGQLDGLHPAIARIGDLHALDERLALLRLAAAAGEEKRTRRKARGTHRRP